MGRTHFLSSAYRVTCVRPHKNMSALIQLLPAYLLWHYGAAWADLWRVYSNIGWFLLNLFSVRILAATLLSPWRRLSEKKSKDTAGLLGQIIINTLTRFFGLFVRFGTILIGLASLLIWTLLSFALFVLWIALPLVSLFLIFAGVRNLFFALV